MNIILIDEVPTERSGEGLRPLTAQERLDHAAEIEALKLQVADIEKMDRQIKIWFKALVKLHNEKCPAAERFTMDELKAKVEELARRP